MCGIVGYIGFQPASPIILKCMEKLEYRGYDSCGVAVLNGDRLSIHKDTGRVADLLRSVTPIAEGSIGIGHTRWATCGEPSKANAHPHTDCSQKIAVVHNGTIDNFQELRQRLIAEGHIFNSETDTEVLPHLIEKHYSGNLWQAVAGAVQELKGTYAVAVVRSGDNQLVLAKKGNPLVVGLSDGEYIVASDATALLDYTDRVTHLEDGDICIIAPEGIDLRRNGASTPVKEERIAWKASDTRLGGYPHYMLKEIHEQPKVVSDTLSDYDNISILVKDLIILRDRGTESLLLFACGTSYHAAMLGKYLCEELLGIPIRLELSSELNHFSRVLAHSLAFAVSQSGETADTLQAARRIKVTGCKLMAITNVMGSQLSRLADLTIYTKAGPEISVASTKTFTAQAALLYSLAIAGSKLDAGIKDDMLANLNRIPVLIQGLLDDTDNIQSISRYLAGFGNVFFIARGVNYPVALEGALKLKEISYIHAEGYAAGELKHGPFALLDDRTPVIAILTRDGTYDAMLTNIREIKTRKAPVIALVEEGNEDLSDIVDKIIEVPRVDPLFSPMLNVVALQLLAYYTALARGCPVDFPRNLAKTVTVE